MYAGRIVEQGPAREVLDNPQHPYTRALADCSPWLEVELRQPLASIPGTAPSPNQWPTGCTFAPRCPLVFERCIDERPLLRRQEHRQAACHLAFGVRVTSEDAASPGGRAAEQGFLPKGSASPRAQRHLVHGVDGSHARRRGGKRSRQVDTRQNHRRVGALRRSAGCSWRDDLPSPGVGSSPGTNGVPAAGGVAEPLHLGRIQRRRAPPSCRRPGASSTRGADAGTRRDQSGPC